MAFRAIKRGLSREQFVVVAIDIDDPTWTEVVDAIMPGYNWQEIRERGEKPVARGSVRAEIIDCLGDVVPDIKPSLTCSLPEGAVRAIIMGSGGASVYFIEPLPHFNDQ